MAKLISQNENGVIYIESDSGDIFGVVSSLKVTDSDGIPFQEDTLAVLENAGFQLEQDFENGSTYIDFTHENGETSTLSFSGDDAELLGD